MFFIKDYIIMKWGALEVNSFSGHVVTNHFAELWGQEFKIWQHIYNMVWLKNQKLENRSIHSKLMKVTYKRGFLFLMFYF